jgi:hypothetical protein
LYGKSILYVKIGETPTVEFDIEFPRISKNLKVSSFTLIPSLNGYLNYFMYFDKPIDMEVHSKTLNRFPEGLPDITVLEDLHEIYGVNHSGLRLLVTAFCKN